MSLTELTQSQHHGMGICPWSTLISQYFCISSIHMQEQIKVSLTKQRPIELVESHPGRDVEPHLTFVLHLTMQCREFEIVFKVPSFFTFMSSVGVL